MTKTKTAGGLAAIATLAMAGSSVLTVLLLTAVVAIVALCWIVADRHRSSHLAMLIRSLRMFRS
ncbi:hypothetical protein ACIBO2_24305 [Nonomuraea sp. NPDC050022]|uniref:hypothetical protein n=1 Tax=Nonomuraea sp. NPDC050022 TaxID=3364358 RepID=UPI0037B51972